MAETKSKIKNPNVKTKVKKVVKSTKTSKKVVKKPAKKAPVKVLKPSQKKTVKKEPQTMEELLQATGYSLRGLKRGQEIEGIITDISKKVLLVDVGAKTEGMVMDKEYGFAQDYIATLNIGDTLKVQVTQPENDRGQVLLSLRKTANEFRWIRVEEFIKTGKAVKVKGLELNKGGVIVKFDLLRGFVPASQFSRQYLGRLRELINQTFSVKVIEVDRSKNRLIFSEKAISEAEILEHQKEALKTVKVNQTYKGVVSGVAPFGIFVRVTLDSAKTKLSLDGLVHISEISWEKVNQLDKLYKMGQEIKVKVIAIDEKAGKLTLSIKRLEGDPWEKISKKYAEGAKVKGTITRLAAFGAFVSLEAGVDGLIHISKIPAEKEIKVGDKINCLVEAVDAEQRRISLGLVLMKKPLGYK
ncbi:S1 RNA-binding domain-containing protein [Patescibacteria group bacterium]|nr:S1 RNA-binding domain-containing protein [Patescibacteria group bacterium]MBU1931852.1 S1 RNA-binding domain-containing protein [Patescibacteria group bacterium]